MLCKVLVWCLNGLVFIFSKKKNILELQLHFVAFKSIFVHMHCEYTVWK